MTGGSGDGPGPGAGGSVRGTEPGAKPMSRPAEPVKLRPGPGGVVPAAEVRTYYDHPVIKPPVWKPEIPWYFFAGGLAGASSTLAALAAVAGDHHVARVARRAAAGAALACPPLLIADLGRPERFLNMLRVFKVTSPMSVGTWLLTAYAPTATAAAVLHELDALPVLGRHALPVLRRVTSGVAAALGPLVATYTAGLVANTSVPVWHEARRILPFVFAGGSITSAGALVTAALPPRHAGRARRVALAGAALEAAAIAARERRLGELAEPYHTGRAGRLERAAKGLTAAGAAVLATQGRSRRPAAVAGGALVLAGQAAERWAVFRAGFQSAENPKHTVGPQRRRLEERQMG